MDSSAVTRANSVPISEWGQRERRRKEIGEGTLSFFRQPQGSKDPESNIASSIGFLSGPLSMLPSSSQCLFLLLYSLLLCRILLLRPALPASLPVFTQHIPPAWSRDKKYDYGIK